MSIVPLLVGQCGHRHRVAEHLCLVTGREISGEDGRASMLPANNELEQSVTEAAPHRRTGSATMPVLCGPVSILTCEPAVRIRRHPAHLEFADHRAEKSVRDSVIVPSILDRLLHHGHLIRFWAGSSRLNTEVKRRSPDGAKQLDACAIVSPPEVDC